uniref:Uncharacterized protein n=1 Tax=Macrostomum lignano TaxID=282301 RepID=A0A1I8FYF6_9PLAT
MLPWGDCSQPQQQQHHQTQLASRTDALPSDGCYSGSGGAKSTREGGSGTGTGTLPVGFYTDQEIRSIWDGQFERLRHQLCAVLQSSADYASEGGVWLESNAGLSRLDDETEGRIRLLTGGLPPPGEYGSMWGSAAPLTQ